MLKTAWKTEQEENAEAMVVGLGVKIQKIRLSGVKLIGEDEGSGGQNLLSAYFFNCCPWVAALACLGVNVRPLCEHTVGAQFHYYTFAPLPIDSSDRRFRFPVLSLNSL